MHERDIDRAEALRERRLRVTPQRLAVLQAVHELHDHPDVRAIAEHARARLGAVSNQAVYDSVRALTEAGLLRRIQPAGSPARYDSGVGDGHHHAVCRGCGAVSDIELEPDRVLAPAPAALGDFAVEEAEITFWGLCGACRRGAGADAAG